MNSARPVADPLRARGLRLTAPRRVILEVVRSTDEHPSAAAVYRAVRERLPGVSLATVYRNLRLLAARGLLAERPGLDVLRFDGNTAPHDHFTCVGCGRVYDLPPQAPPRVRYRVSARTGFEVLEHRMEFVGRCARCRARRGPSRHGTGEELWGARVSRGRRATRT